MSWDFSSSSESENSPDSFKLPPDLTIIPESTAPYRPGSSMSGMPLGYKSSPLASTEVLQSDAQAAATSASPNFCQEIKKGRFSVTEQQETGGGTTPMSDTSSAPSVASPANEGRQKFNVLSIHSDSSNMASPVMSAGESASSPKASRFTVTANESLPPSSVPVVSNDKRSRFEVNSVSDPSTGPAETSPTPSPHPSMGRTSRFAKSVISDSDSQPNTEDLQEKLNTIQRQNLEQQKLLSELVGAMTAAGMSVGGAEGSEALKAIQQKVEQQRKQQLQSSSEDDVSTLIQENRRLREENEALRLRQDALEKKP
ncbi:hypothetical protein BCR33DRAFT_325924 [Rhizoclosmatium globosum]|uniref:Uncharacterized protein n=1 Tax=Rhizoclosmatium globosum TaxID=329046 RepID=A0A1Y2D079_9FUNG|nr:hypothetical protein BCR33DRAFT_325924 [Rhizoclosmatium globosum]|eukprot:ORY52702.1 hypothetical protein BCR33DRAFT_325924 [Rhizoclosmatium globosum]